jgi:hypothetical protein
VISVPGADDVLIKPGRNSGAEAAPSRSEPGHCARLGWPSCSYWPFGRARVLPDAER